MQTLQNIQKEIDNNLALMLYFSAPKCNVCHVLKPKLFEAVKNNFKEFKLINIDISINQDIATHFNVFSIPTILIFLASNEFLRKSRYMSVGEVIKEIKRPYEIMIS